MSARPKQSLIVRIVANRRKIRRVLSVSMTVQQLVSEARLLPREQLNELFELLLAESFGQPDPQIDEAWRTETRRRVAEIQSGQVQGIPGEQVMTELRRVVGL